MESNEAGKQFWTRRGWEKKDFLGFYSKGITDRENLPLFKLPDEKNESSFCDENCASLAPKH